MKRLAGLRLGLVLALGLAATAAAQVPPAPPRIGKPRPAPATPSDVPPLPPAQIDNSLAIGGQEVDARKVKTRLQVEVGVNGVGPYRFVVDSGADSSVVGLRVAESLRLPLGSPAVLNGMTARNIVDRVKVDRLSLGSTVIRDLELPALEESHLGGDGLIGIDALVQQRLMMDFDKRQIRVEDARQPIKTYPGEIVIIAKRRRGQLILTQVRANGLPLDAVIDTGSEVTIGNSALRDKLLRRNRDKFWKAQITGVTGVTVNLDMAIVRELRLGPITMQNVPMAFADVPPFALFGLSGEPALLIGTDLLESFSKVSLDFRARRVRFQLKRCTAAEVMVNTMPDDSLTRLLSTRGIPNVCDNR